MLMVALAVACWSATGHTQGAAGPDTLDVGVDPIRCWWRTRVGAVRVGETFTLALTCAVLDDDQVQVVPDQSPLAPAVINLSPFDVVGGSHPADRRAGLRRFFQYEYTLRLIDPDVIGKDVPLPPLSLHYRVNSRVASNAALEGRDHTYVLPPQSIRMMSMVPADASDIRDGSEASLGLLEDLEFRANALSIGALTLAALGSLVSVLTLVGIFRRERVKSHRTTPLMGTSRIRARVARELADVQRASLDEGWTESLVERGLAALRIAAGLALTRPILQEPAEASARSTEGRLMASAMLRRRAPIALSSTVTAVDMERHLASLPASKVDERASLGDLHSALLAFGTALYGEEATRDRTPLGEAVTRALLSLDQLGHRWRRWRR